MYRGVLTIIAVFLALLVPELHAQEDNDQQALLSATQAMSWRNIGPTRGGRSVAATGVVGKPQTYYMGTTGGGVWKTTDAGLRWENISDGFFNTGSVGAIAVAESDPNVIYVGMGEHAVRGVMTSHGDGVYRSTDAGRTWTHVGLDRTRAISRIRVHPNNPDLVYVAAQGAPYGETEDRGVYRSSDGGETWEQVLYIDQRSGASDLSMDMTNPRILYASFWDHLRRPWVVESGGDGSSIWKSTDGGTTWTEIRNGLPEVMGKTSVDVSRADPDRLFAIVEAADDQGGLYRSDDAGASWEHLSSERIIQTRSWYYMEVYADPTDRETVYVMNAPFLKSIDGGRTFTTVQVPHGDNHDLWINPADNRVMINANDGGANVSFNGGESWSTQRNHATAQFYRVITDNQYPYHVYGGQQDNSAIGMPSAAPGGLGWDDFYSVAGCESAFLAFDPDDPQDVFGGCYQGLIGRWNRTTQTAKPIMAYPFLGLGTYAKDQKFRFNWNAPIVTSPHNPSVIYHAGNVVFRTENGGQDWAAISPDLTRDQEERQGPGGIPITNEGAGGENYNTITYLVESALEPGTIWIGTDDGLIHITRNGGTDWDDITPPGIGEALVNSLELSPHDPAKAYAAVTHFKTNDFTPLFYRTNDYGNSWELITDGIAAEHWARVIREDPRREGLLYGGTELGLYVSFDDGERWHPWQRNLPTVPITDLIVHNDDLVAATQGRAFWILDDLTPVQQHTAETEQAAMHLFQPRTTILANFGGGFGGAEVEGVGSNPPSGAQIYYSFSDEPEGLLTLEVLDGAGSVVRTYATDPEEAGNEHWSTLPAPTEGLNKVAWDLRYEGIQGVDGLQSFGSLAGRLAAPGDYQIRLTHGDEVRTVPLTLEPDPRLDVTASDYRQQGQFVTQVQAAVAELYEAVRSMEKVSGQVEDVVERTEEHPMGDTIRVEGESLVEEIDAWEGELIQRDQKTFQDVINFTNKLDAQLLDLVGTVDGTEPPVTTGARARWTDLSSEWAGHREALGTLMEAVRAFNAWIIELGIDPIVLPQGRIVS